MEILKACLEEVSLSGLEGQLHLLILVKKKNYVVFRSAGSFLIIAH